MTETPAFRTPPALSEFYARALLDAFDTFEVGTGRDDSPEIPSSGLLRDPQASWVACQDGFPNFVGGQLIFVAVYGDGQAEFPHRERIVRARRKSDGAVMAVSPRFTGSFGVKECGECVVRIRYVP